MATILAHITVKPGCAARFEQIAAELYRATHDHEPNVRRYEYWRGAEPDTYYTLLSYDTFAEFIEHQASDHHETASPQLSEVLAGIRLEWVDPLPDASPLGRTRASGSPPEDVEQLSRRYWQRYSAQIADWWPA